MHEDEHNSLVVVIGDIHGRFHRVREWIAALESARGRTASLIVSVGDVEAFLTADDHRRKAAKRSMPAEFADYVGGRCSFERPLYFIGGNNEDFEALHEVPEGAEIAANLHYLGRVGTRTIAGFNLAFLSGIYAPRYVDKPLLPPTTSDACRQAGYFRHSEVAALDHVTSADIMLAHEWPRAIASRAHAQARGQRRDLRAFHTPWIGNAITRGLAETIAPQWLFCGHSHMPFATALHHPNGAVTHIACLDQASRADGAVFWTEWRAGEAVLAGWGTTGEVSWRQGQPWDERRTPQSGVATRPPARRPASRRPGSPEADKPLERPLIEYPTPAVALDRPSGATGASGTRNAVQVTDADSTGVHATRPRDADPEQETALEAIARTTRAGG
ncbi:MAG: metallophosphoesterase [Deltaproteobacteria bacterium]|nr:metallophosphoesterase [Deltaproteobacteria bacterium]